MHCSFASASSSPVVPRATMAQPKTVLCGRRAASASALTALKISMPSAMSSSSMSSSLPIRRLASSSPPLSSRRSTSLAAASEELSTATKPFELHVGSTTLSLPFNSQRASELRAALSLLLATFAEKAKAERPKRWQSLEYRFKSGSDGGNEGGGDSGNEGGGDSGSSTPPGIAFFEVFCNPNAAASPFDAKVLVTVRSTNGGVGFTTEAPLSALRADLEAFCASS